MAGKPKTGIDYAGWSVSLFDGDTKIDKLLDAQGWVGFGIYFYLCQMAYKFDGYFYRWSYDDSATTARRMGGGVGSETVKQTVGLCLQIGLFDKRLFDRDGILTSKGIQRRFCAAIQTRRVKTVISDYWLLNDEESRGLLKCAKNGEILTTNVGLHGANVDLLPANATKSKVKQSKVNGIDVDRACACDVGVSTVISAFLDKVNPDASQRSLEELTSYVKLMDAECCLRAIEIALDNRVAKWSYIRKILMNKASQGVRCISDWDKLDAERGNKNGRTASSTPASDGTFRGWRAKSALDDTD